MIIFAIFDYLNLSGGNVPIWFAHIVRMAGENPPTTQHEKQQYRSNLLSALSQGSKRMAPLPQYMVHNP